MDERAVFLKFELFAKRLGKLCFMFTSIDQISGLENHTHITGDGFACLGLKSCFTVYQLCAKCSLTNQPTPNHQASPPS